MRSAPDTDQPPSEWDIDTWSISPFHAWLATGSGFRWFIVSIAVIAPALTFLFSAQLRDGHDHWLSQRDVAAARVFNAGGERGRALSRLINAFERTPQNPSVLRELALATATDHPEYAKPLCERLSILGAATHADKITHARVLARLNDNAGATALLFESRNDTSRGISFWQARGDIATAAGRITEARTAYLQALAISPSDTASLLGLARAAAASSDPAQHGDAAERLITHFECSLDDLSAAQREDGLAALATLRIEDGSLRSRFSRLLHRLPRQTLVHCVTDTLLQLPPGSSPEQTARSSAAVASLLDGHRLVPADQRRAITAILLAHDEHENLIRWLPIQTAMLDAVLFSHRIDALMALGRWREAATMAARLDAPVPPASRHLLQALVLLTNPDRTPTATLGAADLLKRALVEASVEGRQGAYVAIGHIALDFALHDIAADAFARALDLPFGRHLPLDAFILASRRAARPLDEILQQLDQRALTDRTNLDLQMHTAYLRLLTGDRIETTAQALEQICKRLPHDSRARFLHAFALHRLGDFAGALAKLTPFPNHRWHHGEAAVIAAILAASGDILQATRIAANVTTAKTLFPEEAAMMSAIRANPTTRDHMLTDFLTPALSYLSDKTHQPTPSITTPPASPAPIPRNAHQPSNRAFSSRAPAARLP